LITALIRLADDKQTQMGKLIDDAGPIAGLFVLVLGVCLFLLWRSLNRQIKRIDPTLPEGEHDLEQDRDREYTEQAVERGEGDEPTRG
jgi:ABC-type nickel/cobalt efflux system permease component RcnA